MILIVIHKNKTMNICDPSHPLFKVVKGHILHCTSPSSYRLICADGHIRINDGKYPYTWGENSCIHQLGGISLLDFGLPEDKIFFVDDQDNFPYPWESILTAHYPLTIIIKLDRKRLYDKILPWDYIKEKTDKCNLIPFTEVCTLDPISISLFEGIVLASSSDKFIDVPQDYCSKELLDEL